MDDGPRTTLLRLEDPPRPLNPSGATGSASADQCLQDAKLAALAEFAAGAGHEINNPLGSIIGRVELLLRDETDPERRRLLTSIGGQAYRIRDMIGDLMLFARPPAPHPETLNATEVIETVLARFADRFSERRIVVTGDRAPSVPIHADRTQLAVVIGELVRNAIDAVDDGGTIQVDVHSERTAPAEHGPWSIVHGPSAVDHGPWTMDLRTVLTVTDNGRGLSDHERAHLFDPFFSGRNAGRGLGFGLCKCWRIVTQHGGRISVDNNATAGVTARVEWPSPHTK